MLTFLPLSPIRDLFPRVFKGHRITQSFLGRIPWSGKFHRHLLPLYPMAVEQLDLRGYDLVITSDAGPMKGVIVAPGTFHICYCHPRCDIYGTNTMNIARSFQDSRSAHSPHLRIMSGHGTLPPHSA